MSPPDLSLPPNDRSNDRVMLRNFWNSLGCKMSMLVPTDHWLAVCDHLCQCSAHCPMLCPHDGQYPRCTAHSTAACAHPGLAQPSHPTFWLSRGFEVAREIWPLPFHAFKMKTLLKDNFGKNEFLRRSMIQWSLSWSTEEFIVPIFVNQQQSKKLMEG